MKRDSLAFALSGVFFGLIVGWIIGSQQNGASASSTAGPVPAAAPAASQQPAQPASPAAPFDAVRAANLERQAAAEPANAGVRIELGDIYFDGERFSQAIPWYQAALKLNPKNANASTDLGIVFYRLEQYDQALAQFDKSLAIDPKHVKTLFNQGIVRAFGKQDLAGAVESWQKVVAIAPDSEEGKRAKQGLDGINSSAAHAGAGGTASPGGTK